MHHQNRNRALRSIALVATLAAVPLGCGDGPICASEVVVVIASMSNGDDITNDTSADPGMQIDVPVRSNLKQGDTVTLTIMDAAGQEVATHELTSDGNGDVLFQGVDVPPGQVTLRVEGSSRDCGSGTDQIQVNVNGAGACGLVIREGPLASDYYAPLPVLSTINDSDGSLPGFQANVDITTSPGFDVELFVLDVASGIETSAGTISADGEGLASFPLTLAQGRQVLWAECVSSSGTRSDSSGNTSVFVDTEAPACDLVYPTAGSSIIPAMDADGDPTNGTQITLIGTAAGDDIDGEIAMFTIDGAESEGSPLDESGQSMIDASFNDVGSYELGFRIHDHAGNACSVSRAHEHVIDGCGITYIGPQDPVTADSNGDPADGLQTEVQVQVDPECVGQTVTTDCGVSATSTTVPAGGLTTLEVTLCADATCEVNDACTVSVSNAAGIVTSVGTTIVADTLPPNVDLQFVNPVIACGDAVAASADRDGDPGNGVQIDVRVVSPLALTRSVAVTSSSGTVIEPSNVGGDTRITLEPGANDVVALASDQHGNQGQTPPCEIFLQDLAISFDPPIADGLVGTADGVVSGSTLTLDICGTVSEAGATVEVAINGGAAQAATVTGTAWCLSGVSLAESPPVHSIEVSATAGPRLGSRTLALLVDLTPPGPIGNFAASAPTRQSALLSWIAPADSGAPVTSYRVKMATVPLNAGNFDTTGTLLAPPAPEAPGTGQTLLVEQLRAGTSYYFAVVALDLAGNRSSIEALGPIIPDFDGTGAIGPVSPADGENGLGFQMARGDFNGDGFSDLAVSAPYKTVGADLGAGTVYVYFGGAGGLINPAVPDVTIEGVGAGNQFGNGLTAIQWGGDAADDLAIGAPFAGNYNGRAYIFFGGAGFSAVTGPADADVEIRGGGGWFNSGYLGWSLAAARFDSDASDDLVIGVVGGGIGNGGVAVVYGGSGATSIVLDDTNPAASNGATTLVIRDPDPAVYDLFGNWVFNLGRTEGSADTRDDIGVAYFEGASAFVIRGRSRPATPGVTLASFNPATDLQIQNNSTDPDGVIYFGSTMGSIEDQNGDNARDVVIGSWGEGNYNGRVVIVDGNAVGTQSVATIAIATITPGAGVRALGTAVVNNALAVTAPDVNNDGLEDLLIVGNRGASAQDVSLFVWYGGSIPSGSATTASANHIVAGPAVFNGVVLPSGGTPITALWAGDVNGDGLEDICWADHGASSRDGAFELLWDDGV